MASTLIDRISFRAINEEDVSICAEIEKKSYPADEMASISTFQYRRKHAGIYFRCCELRICDTTLPSSHDNIDDTHGRKRIIGYVCSTRCNDFTHESMFSNHLHDGPILAIHSVVVCDEYRRKGIATAMLQNYVQSILMMTNETCTGNINLNDTAERLISTALQTKRQQNHVFPPIERIVLLSKSHLLSFYVNCGFQVLYVHTFTT
jgi:GNAT superfamily N-acetyltransferase